jgi:hypothetical protein
MACSSAVLGIYFSLSESGLTHLVDNRLPDEVSTVAAGALAEQLGWCASSLACCRVNAGTRCFPATRTCLHGTAPVAASLPPHTGFITMALFRSPRGPRAAAIAGAVGAAAAGALAAARQYFPSL